MGRFRHSARLRATLELLTAPASAASRAFWTHPRLEAALPEYLFLLHCATRASVPLMEAARARARELGAVDPVAAALVEYLTAHIPEERHHDDWLLEDLAVLGVARRQVLARVPPPSVAALVGSQYYWVYHHHPVALLGYIAVLEGYPLSSADLERAIERTGLPRAAFRTLFAHSDLDQDHRNALYRMLDRLPLTHAQAGLIAASGLWTLHLVSQVLEEVVETADSRRSAPPPPARGRTARRAPAATLPHPDRHAVRVPVQAAVRLTAGPRGARVRQTARRRESDPTGDRP